MSRATLTVATMTWMGDQMTDPIDLDPSKMRLLEIGALQERVRTLEAHIANMGSIGERMALAGMGMGNLQAVSYELYTYMTLYDIGDIVRAVRERRARALSEMAAADAEMLEPPVMDRLEQLKRDPHLHVSPHEALEQEGAATIAQIKHDALPPAPDCA